MTATGFQGFRAAIERATADIGGGRHVRAAVAEAMTEKLRHALADRLRINMYDLPSWIWWTLCEDADFDKASGTAPSGALRLREGPIQAEGTWRGAKLVLRDGCACLEGESHAIVVALSNTESSTPRVFLTDGGKLALYGSGLSPSSKPTSVSVRSREAAQAALVRMVEGFFGVKLAHAPASAAAD